MDIKQAIEFGESRLGLFGGQMEKFIEQSLEALREAEQEPKTGNWLSYWDEDVSCYVYKCPKCGNKQPFDTKYCWECGLKNMPPVTPTQI